MRKPAVTPRQHLCLLLGALVWASQWLIAIHGLDHLVVHPDEKTVCPLCLAAVGLDQPLTSQPLCLPPLFSPVYSCVAAIALLYAERSRAVPARGPPRTVS
ncbi:MAG: hypothetical protein H6970_13505 [Gammaproteobacteria bacterium]|nr:hypothetical protein [Gammaproteobacteria bacterium]MCP5426063.1 hypothetical protein [Gammaproteobacteria bacterium]